ADRIEAAAGGSLTGKRIGLLGLTFKPNTDDMRDSPSLAIVPALLAKGATVRTFDPKGTEEAKKLLSGIEYAKDAYDALDRADVMVLVTEWNEFRAFDWDRVAAMMSGRVVVDLRNVYNPEQVAAAGFAYHSIGRATALPPS